VSRKLRSVPSAMCLLPWCLLTWGQSTGVDVRWTVPLCDLWLCSACCMCVAHASVFAGNRACEEDVEERERERETETETWFGVQGKMYVVGGRDEKNHALQTVECFDGLTHTCVFLSVCLCLFGHCVCKGCRLSRALAAHARLPHWLCCTYAPFSAHILVSRYAR